MQILYFKRLRGTFGLGAETLNPPADATIAGLLAGHRSFRVAVDQSAAPPDAPLKADSEVAIFPPVTGG